MLMAAAVAFDPQEPVFEPPTAQIILELFQHEAGKRSLIVPKFLTQARQMLLNDRIQRGILWLMSPIASASTNPISPLPQSVSDQCGSHRHRLRRVDCNAKI